MFAQEVPWWCGVDVTDENGLVRRGMIRSKASDGLFVDFDYPGHNNDFVPVDHCNNQAQAYGIGDAVEALYRAASDQPWRWYPAKFLLTGSPDGFTFVGIDTGETVVEKVVSVDAVRTVDGIKLSGSQIFFRYFEYDFEIPKAGDLGKLTSGLMDTFVGGEFLKIWNRETPTFGRKLEGGRLFYCSQRGKPWAAADIENIFKRMARRYLPCEAVSSVTVTDGAVHPESMDIDQFDLMDDPITAQLSLDVMDEIFSFLTPIQQAACRKVCDLWNSILTSIPITFWVEIDISTVGYRQLATMLHKSVTESTKCLVLSGGSSVPHSPNLHRLRTVKMMLKAMNLNVRFVVLSRTRVEAEGLLEGWYSAECNGLSHFKWRDVCDTLILNNIVVWLPLASKVSLVVRKESLDVKVDRGMEGVLDKWCPDVSGPEMDVLERKLRRFWRRNERCDRFYLWMLLTKYQPADKRFHPYATGNFPPAGTLGVPALASLRKLTVWALTGYRRVTV